MGNGGDTLIDEAEALLRSKRQAEELAPKTLAKSHSPGVSAAKALASSCVLEEYQSPLTLVRLVRSETSCSECKLPCCD